MIKIYDNEAKTTRVLNKICKKLKIDTAEIKFAAYEKFLFAYLFAFAIKGKSLYLFAENSKDIQELDVSEIKGVSVDKHHDLNLDFYNGKTINLTSIVNITKTNHKIIKTLDNSIKKSH